MASTEQYSRSQYSAGITKCTVHTGRLAEHLAFTSNKAVVVHSDSDPVLSRLENYLEYTIVAADTAQHKAIYLYYPILWFSSIL